MIYGLMGANILMLAAFIWRLPTLPPQIPLFYSRAWGEDQLADSWMIMLIPFLINLLIIFNHFLYGKFFAGNEFMRKVFDYVNVFIIVAFTAIFLKILFLVT